MFHHILISVELQRIAVLAGELVMRVAVVAARSHPRDEPLGVSGSEEGYGVLKVEDRPMPRDPVRSTARRRRQ